MSESINQSIVTPARAIAEGWARFLDDRRKPLMFGGVSHGTWKRYRKVSVNHLKFCNSHGIEVWSQINAGNIADYARRLQEQGMSVRSAFLEKTAVKAVLRWLREQGTS